MKLWFFLSIFITFNGQPFFAQNQTLNMSTSFTYQSKHFLGLKNGLRSSDKGIVKLNINHNTDSSSSQLAINYDGYNNFNLDRSYLQYTSGIATFGVGAINRHWSLSNNESLILSHNARPSKAIYLKLKNRFGYDWLPSKANWSLEVFNGYTEGSLKNSNSMLLGIRTVLSASERLDFEILQTSQWGGNDYSSGISALGSALIFDTNKDSNANINKMAGFGISYLIPSNKIPLRIYGQAIGEDEAGNLPSCYGYLAGLEWTNTEIKYPTVVGIEAIDTRIDTSTNGYCGPNTMYNNSTYKYSNYGDTMGAEISTEGTSYGLYLQSQISQKINVKFTTKSIVINDNDWSDHPLSSKRQSGFVNSFSVSWFQDNVSFKTDIYNQNFNLDKADIENSYGVGFSSSIIF